MPSSGWTWRRINETKGINNKPLYRWPQIVAAVTEDREIAVVEGEKDADRLWSIGIPATTNFDGATDTIKNPKAKPKWKAEYSEALRGARIIVSTTMIHPATRTPTLSAGSRTASPSACVGLI